MPIRAPSYTTPFNLAAGTYTFTVREMDSDDLTTSSSNGGSLTIQAQVVGDQSGPKSVLQTRVWSRVATAADAGTRVRINLAASKFDLTIAASGVDPTVSQ